MRRRRSAVRSSAVKARARLVGSIGLPCAVVDAGASCCHLALAPPPVSPHLAMMCRHIGWRVVPLEPCSSCPVWCVARRVAASPRRSLLPA